MDNKAGTATRVRERMVDLSSQKKGSALSLTHCISGDIVVHNLVWQGRIPAHANGDKESGERSNHL